MYYIPILLSLLAAGCERIGLERLAGHYYLAMGDSAHRYVVNLQTERIVIDHQVVSYDVVGPIVLIRRMVATSYDCYGADGASSIITHYSDEEEYWYIDTDRDWIEGPLDAAGFEAIAHELGVSADSLRKKRPYWSNEAQFKALASKCKTLQ